MRLLNTHTLTLHPFTPSNLPPYTILSHRWGHSEPDFKDFTKNRTQASPGHKKITSFCQFLQEKNFEWTWIDTICIDKRSSAELSEAINSMYKWYANAAICFVYLGDISTFSKESKDTGLSPEELLEAFSESNWWTRGWTLQELLAPRQVVFLSSSWRILGRKLPKQNSSIPFDGDIFSSDIICWSITQRTKIPSEVLTNPNSIRRFSIAQRMSWASARQTTRIEDRAYSLLGLFGINMPLLYGEGEKAFQRLQEEIIRSSHDETIYAWTHPSTPKLTTASPILAASPDDFANSGDVVRTLGILRSPWTVTHHGLEVPLVADNHNSSKAVELPGFDIHPSKRNAEGDQSGMVAIAFPLACKRKKENGDDEPCNLLIVRLRCGHWGRISTGDLSGRQQLGWKPMMVKFERLKVYVHVDDCEDLVMD